MKIGTAISRVATPIAGVFGADCYDPITRDLRPGSPCYEVRNRLDSAHTLHDVASAIFDRFWSKSKKGNNPMEETVEELEWLLQVAVTAPDIKTAMDRLANGKVLSINPRPQVQFGGGQVQRISPAGQVIRSGS